MYVPLSYAGVVSGLICHLGPLHLVSAVSLYRIPGSDTVEPKGYRDGQYYIGPSSKWVFAFMPPQVSDIMLEVWPVMILHWGSLHELSLTQLYVTFNDYF